MFLGKSYRELHDPEHSEPFLIKPHYIWLRRYNVFALG